MSEVLWRLKALIHQFRISLKARIPEKVVIFGSYAANTLLIFSQYVFLRPTGETPFVQFVDLVVALQLLFPFFLMDFVPLFHYFALVTFIVAGSVLNLVPEFPVYYYALTFVTIINIIKLEPILTTSPAIIKVTMKIRRATKKANPPKTKEEAIFIAKISAVHIASFVISIGIYVVKGYLPALAVSGYSLVALLFFFLNIGVNPLTKVPKEKKYSLTLLFVLRYPLLFRIANKMKMKIHPLTERAGVNIYELEYVAKYLAYFIWYLMILPTIILIAYTVVPWDIFLLILPALALIPAIVYYMPTVLLISKAKSRKNGVEKEYPIFLAYASALISAGYTLYTVFRDLARGRGAELFKTFTNEAKYFLSLVEKQGLPELRALERYASTHPSSEFRNFILGYMHQSQLGGRLSIYIEQKLMEALDTFKRRMENYVNQIVLLTEIALTVLVIPTLPMVIGFIIAPDIVYKMLFMQIFVFIPAVGFMFYSVTSSIQFEFHDEYRFTYVPSVVGAVAGLAVAIFFIHQKIFASIALIIGVAALGFYTEYAMQRRVFAEIEKYLPQVFRDLSELRHIMPIAEAIGRMTKMGYPRNVSRILRRLANLRTHGIRISEQGWHSKSWFWKFTQFLLGKIEESGGGTVELFRQLMLFFTEFNGIMSSVRAHLKIYELVIYAIPAIFGLTTYSTLGIFVTMTQVSKSMGFTTVSAQAMSQLGAQFPQLMRIFTGISPTVLLINDVIIFEMALVLGLLGGKIVSGTAKDTRALAISMIVAALVILLAPQFVQNMLYQSLPPLANATTTH